MPVGKIFRSPLQYHAPKGEELKSSSVQLLRLLVCMLQSMLFWVHDCIEAIGQIEAELYSKHFSEKESKKGDEEDSCSDKSSGGEMPCSPAGPFTGRAVCDPAGPCG
eukprot:3819823-Rhodomonas_salina.2